MEQIINTPVRPRRTLQQINVLLDSFDQGDGNVAEFCLAHDICRATFHKWQSRYRVKGEQATKANGFAALQITGSSLTNGTALFAEVKGIRIFQPVAASYLKELIAS